MPTKKCKTCKALLDKPGDNYDHIPFIAAGNCHSCYHWSGVLNNKDENSRSVRTENGGHYYVDTKRPMSRLPDRSLGHGGQTYKVTFDDGTEIITNNLWFQGTMPEFWLKKFPPNATVEAIKK